MVKFTSILGLKVFDKATGKIIGVLDDGIINNARSKLEGFYVLINRILSRRFFVQMEDVTSITKDGVFISDKCKEIEKLKKNDFRSIEEILYKTSVFSKDGNELGKISDFFIDEKTGRIDGLEISEGFSEDIYFGRKLLPIIEKVEFGEDIMTVDKESQEEIINKKGLIKFFKKEE